MSEISAGKVRAGVAGLAALGIIAVTTSTAMAGEPSADGWQRGTTAVAAVDTAKERATLDAVVAAGAPGAVAVVRDAAGSRRLAAGSADTARHQWMTPDAKFRAGSITKTFVATLTLQLVGEGKLSLDDPVGKHLPGVVANADRITVRQLLSLRSGVGEYIDEIAPELFTDPAARRRSWTPEQLLAIANAKPVASAPGERFEYVNTNYVLAGLLIERITRNSLQHEITRRIVQPLGLTDTSFPITEHRMPAGSSRGYTAPVDERGTPVNGPLRDITEQNPSWAWAAGSLISDTDDLAHFYTALLGGRLLEPALLNEMTTMVPTGEQGIPRYGLGLFEIDTPCGPWIGHSGDIPGFATLAFIKTDGSRQVVLSVNTQIMPEAVASARGEAFFALACPANPKTTPATAELRVSRQADRSGSQPLQGQKLSGTRFIFVANQPGITKVSFYLNDPQQNKKPFNVERSGKGGWDLARTQHTGGPAKPFNTDTLATGRHTLTAVVESANGATRSMTAVFTVKAPRLGT